MLSRFCLSVAAFLALAMAAHGDDAIRSDGTRLTGRLTLSDTGRFRFGDEPVAGLDFVRFTPEVPAAPPVPICHRVHLVRGEVILAEVRKLDEKDLHVRTVWANALVIPRTAVERVTHLPGWRSVFLDTFDPMGPWTKIGEPRAIDGKLVLDRAGQAIEAAIKPGLAAGRVAVTFQSAAKLDRRVSLEVGFVRGDKPAPVRVELVGPGGLYTVNAPDKPDRAGKVKRDAGTHRLTVEFDKDRLAIFIDEFVLWVRNAGPGELRSVKFISEGNGTEAAAIDDVLVIAAEPVGEPRAWADLTADAVRSKDGDETFGSLSAVGPRGATLDVRGKKFDLGWPDTVEFTFRRGPVIEKPTSGEHVHVRLRTAEGLRDELSGAVKAFDERTLVLVHPILGELSLPRDRIEEVRFRFHGRRLPIDSVPHHLGARPAFGFAVPKPEGLSLLLTNSLDQPAGGFAAIDAAQLSGAGTPVEVLINGEGIGELNRLADRSDPTVRTYQLPVAAGKLKRGENKVEVRLRPQGDKRVSSIDMRAVRLELVDPR